MATYIVVLYPLFILYLIDSHDPESILVACQGDLCRPPYNKLLKHIAFSTVPQTGWSGYLFSLSNSC